MLDKQIQIYSCDTGNFYSNHELNLHLLNHKLRVERYQLVKGGFKKSKNNAKKTILGLKDIEQELSSYEIYKNDINSISSDEYQYDKELKDEDKKQILYLCTKYCQIKDILKHKNKKIKEIKEKLLQLMKNKVETNITTGGKDHIRELKDNKVSQKEIISVFDSSFTRMIGAKIDGLSEDFMVIQVYFFDILKDIMLHGFNYNGEKYIFFTASAGQIRTKKAVFVKETIWNKYEKTIMCGLTMEKINALGGVNPNKCLAYMALNNSATDVWEEFDIDKTIVVDDFETMVYGKYDFIDERDFSITRKKGELPIPHTDGCGMILPNAFGKKQKNTMIRLCWIKGLLGVFDFKKFIEVNNANSIIKDIYGVEHNVIEEDIQVIFTKSQFKLWRYYSSWSEYKENYKKYNCSAGFTNPEEDRIKNATINYQMLQSLTDITDDEIKSIVGNSIDKLTNLCSSIESVKNVFGATPYNLYKNALQKSMILYPELLNDIHIKTKLREIKDSLVKRYKSGKLQVNGKYTFILPDLYAACEYWFLNNSNPKGLLDNEEVFCWLFRKNEKLDCLRSPHLFFEHAVRNNIACYKYEDRQAKIKEWFDTNALYTSCHDLITLILVNDVDGDKALVVADKTIVEVAERNRRKYDIVPLYYEMKKAKASILSKEVMYNNLVLAFTSAPIGRFSNDISKIWGSGIFENGTDEEKKNAIDCIKRLCCQNNFTIDYAKTLYKPEFPEKTKQEIQRYTRMKLPYYFKFAKDKEDEQVEPINNCFVNKILSSIPSPRISCKYTKDNGKKGRLEKPDYRLLMSNPDLEFNEAVKPVISKYKECAREYGKKMSVKTENNLPHEILTKTQIKQNFAYQQIIRNLKDELSKFGYSECEVSDILVKYLYDVKNSKSKDLLWLCYGDCLYKNLSKHIKPQFKEIQCIDCGEWFMVVNKDNRTNRCEKCYAEFRKNYYKINKRKQRLKQKMSLST